MAEFPDHFSETAHVYAQVRPTYPEALYTRLLAQVPGRGLAWDCATGSGQAAQHLASAFDRVVATDASAAQLERAEPHPKIDYREALAETSGLDAGSVDLITVAAAIHWFDRPRFYEEARRVAAPGAVLAAWTYGASLRIEPAIDAVIHHLADEILRDFWPPEIKHVRTGYEALDFPFAPLPGLGIAAGLASETHYDLAAMRMKVHSWSGVRAYKKAKGADPLALVDAELAEAWGDPDMIRPVLWPLHARVGQILPAS